MKKINPQAQNLVRQCISCRTQVSRDGLIRLTKIGPEEIIANPNKHKLGRSAYLCKSTSCINVAIKEKKIAKMLRVSLRVQEKIIPQLQAILTSHLLVKGVPA